MKKFMWALSTAFAAMLPLYMVAAQSTAKVTWSPDLSKDAMLRAYKTLDRASHLDKDWTPVTDANKSQMRFFKVKVEIK